MKRVYALLSVLGLVLPYYFFVPFLVSNGLNVRLIIDQLFANQISAFFGVDVVASSLVLWAFIYNENRRRRVPGWWLAVIANLTVGVSMGLPLFLWLREAAMEKDTRNIVQ